MCGGYYEEEFEMQGPAVQFKSEAGFHQAIGICMKHLLAEEWTMDENLKRITFATPGVEQRYTIISTGLKMTEVLIHFWQASMESILIFVAAFFMLGFWVLAFLMLLALIIMPVGIISEKLWAIWGRVIQKHR